MELPGQDLAYTRLRLLPKRSDVGLGVTFGAIDIENAAQQLDLELCLAALLRREAKLIKDAWRFFIFSLSGLGVLKAVGELCGKFEGLGEYFYERRLQLQAQVTRDQSHRHLSLDPKRYLEA